MCASEESALGKGGAGSRQALRGRHCGKRELQEPRVGKSQAGARCERRNLTPFGFGAPAAWRAGQGGVACALGGCVAGKRGECVGSTCVLEAE